MMMFERANRCFAVTFVIFTVLFSLPGIGMVGEFIEDWRNRSDANNKLKDNCILIPAAKTSLSPYRLPVKKSSAEFLPSPRQAAAVPRTCAPAANPRFAKIEAAAKNIQAKIRSVLDDWEKCVTDEFPLRFELSEYNMGFKRLIGMRKPLDMQRYIFAPDGALLLAAHYGNIPSNNAEHFNKLTRRWGGEYLVVIRPFPEGSQDRAIYYGCDLRLNRPLDEVRRRLAGKGIRVLDLRENFARRGLETAQVFFKTDHHWNSLGALAGAYAVAEYLNKNAGCSYDLKYFTPEVFDRQIYKSSFIGSFGKKFSRAYMDDGPEDMLILRPSWKTSFTTERRANLIQDFSMVRRGDFSVFMEFEKMFDKQPYLRNNYAVFCGSDSYFYRVVNHLMPEGKKIAIIKDSYANIMVPFLALQSREIIMLDERHTGKDIDRILLAEKPDIVIYMNSYFDLI